MITLWLLLMQKQLGVPMKINLRLGCTVQTVNDSMNIEILEGDNVLYTGSNLDSGKLDINCTITWPSVIIIKLSNKGPDDTVVDGNGIVVNDKAIILEELALNNFPLELNVMEQLVDGIIYWGFNGEIKMNFTEKNPMRWLLKMKNRFNVDRLLWN